MRTALLLCGCISPLVCAVDPFTPDGTVEDDEGVPIPLAHEVAAAAALNRQSYRRANKTMEIYLVPHTHADTGWQITYDQCFEQLLDPIISTTMQALSEDPSHRYTWSDNITANH